MGKGMQHKGFTAAPSALGIVGMLGPCSPGILAPVPPGPALQGGEWLPLEPWWLRGFPRRAGWDGDLGPAMQEPLHGESGPGLCCERVCRCLAVVGTNALLPPGRGESCGASAVLGARSTAKLAGAAGQHPLRGWSGSASLQGAPWPPPGRSGLGRGACQPGGCARQEGPAGSRGALQWLSVPCGAC